MSKKRYTRFALFLVGILLLVLMVIPSSLQTRIRPVLSPKLELPEGGVESSPEEEHFEKLEKPVYFSIFKFITGFIPSRQKQTLF